MKYFSPATRAKFRAAKLGKRNPTYGKHRPRDVRERISATMERNGVSSKERNPRWKGGVASERKRAYYSRRYKMWRAAVFARDIFQCRVCGRVGGRLHAHHIKPWSMSEGLRYSVDNGLTVCAKPCHQRIHGKVRVKMGVAVLTVQKKGKI